MDDLAAANLEARIDYAIFKSARTAAFLKQFPPIQAPADDSLPPMGWAQVERQLRHLAGPDFERTAREVEILRASARTSPPEMLLRDLLTLAWSLIDGAGPLPKLREAAMD